MTIAYFGTGLLGSEFVRAMLARGERVRVWNRTPAKAQALRAEGAIVCVTPAEALDGAEQLHLTLSDDASVDAVLEPLDGTIRPSVTILDHTTTAPTPTAARVQRWRERGITYVHAPVFMGPGNAREASGLMLLSGEPEIRERVKPMLAPMTGKIVEVGDDPSHAAAFKLMGNMMLVFVVTGMADMFKFAASLGIEAHEAYHLFSHFMPVNAINVRGKQMASGHFDPQWELTMARKDVRLMSEEAALHGENLDVLPAIAALFDRYIAGGHGSRDVGVVALRTP